VGIGVALGVAGGGIAPGVGGPAPAAADESRAAACVGVESDVETGWAEPAHAFRAIAAARTAAIRVRTTRSLSVLARRRVKPTRARRRDNIVGVNQPSNSFTSGREYLVPTSVSANRAASTLELQWPDGHVTRYDFETLRWLCPCAYCRGEAGIPGWLDSNPTLTTAQTEMKDLHLVGNYAIAPEWGDGHHTGFYTFARLREECPCA
jgi:DUF971 family protein